MATFGLLCTRFSTSSPPPKLLMIQPSVLLPFHNLTQHGTQSLYIILYYVSTSVLYFDVVWLFECPKPACFEADALISGFRYQMCVLLRGSQSICNESQSCNFLKPRCRHGRLWSFANWPFRGGGQGPRLYSWLRYLQWHE